MKRLFAILLAAAVVAPVYASIDPAQSQILESRGGGSGGAGGGGNQGVNGSGHNGGHKGGGRPR